MFEDLCALLLWLYPAEFRRAYGREAVQLMTDRARHERGVFLRVRLLLDLAIDLGATRRHGWHSSKPLLARIDGAPRFDIIDMHRPHPAALAVGMLMSVLMFATFTLLFQPMALPNAPAFVSERPGADIPGAGSNHSAQQAIAAVPEARHNLTAAIAENLKQRYVDRAIGQELADALLAHAKKGEYDSLVPGAILAARINRDIETTSRTLGIPRGVFVAEVVHSTRPVPTGPPPTMTQEMRGRHRATMLQQNCLFETIEMLPQNVGYMKLNGFADATACHGTTAMAMASLNDAKALIVDLRDNEGGCGDTALQLAGYLFDRPTFIYDPCLTSPVPARTVSPVSGNKLVKLVVVAQSQTFEVISIKPARSSDPGAMRMRVLPNGDLTASGVPVLLLVGYAYDVPVNPSPRLSGLPRWRETYDIEANAPANAVPPGLPEHEKRRRVQAMIRGLLADRFKLVLRVEQKRMPVYALTVASGGPNLQKSTIAEKDCNFDTGTPDGCHNFVVGRGHPLNAKAITMDDVAVHIENWADLPVVNRTAVSGLFAVETEGWRPLRLPPPPPGTPAVSFDDLPTIFTVLRKLGLELKRQEATVPVYTVEHIERPAGG